MQNFGDEKNIQVELYREHMSETATVDLDTEYYRVITEWFHSAIMELTYVKGFQSNPEWIAEQLGITETDAREAIWRLKALNILKVHDGKLIKNMGPTYTNKENKNTFALRSHQKQLLEKSLEALERDPIDQRCHSGMTMAINPKMVPAAKLKIQQFLKEMEAFMEETPDRTEVYQLQVSLYAFHKIMNKN